MLVFETYRSESIRCALSSPIRPKPSHKAHSQSRQCPWGPWPKDPHLKEIGRYQYINAIESVDSYGLALMTRGVGYTEDQAKIFLAIVKNQLRTKSLHAYNLM